MPLVASPALGWLLSGPAGAQDGAQQIRGTMEVIGEGERRPAGGVAVVVRLGDTEIGRATSASDGAWEVPVPGSGTYSVRLLVETLPAGVALTNPDRVELTQVEVAAGQRKTVRFTLGPGVAQSVTRAERISNLAVLGIRFGAIIALSSIGLSLVYGISRLVNFAHGELVTLGAVMAFLFSASGAGPGWHLLAAIVPAMLAVGVFGGLLELGLWRPLRRRGTGTIALMLVSIGLALMIRYLIIVIFGRRPRSYRHYNVQEPVEFLTVSVPPKSLVIIGVSAALLLVVGLLLRHTRMGTAMRAVAGNVDLAQASGVDTQRVLLVTWVVGSALTALGGVFFGISETVEWDMGFRLLLLIFAGVILGGIGTAYGAMVGGFLVGLLTELSTYWVDADFKTAIGLGMLVVMLLARPQGLLGVRGRVG
jgi:branched-chain amino acid transport system permease protein